MIITPLRKYEFLTIKRFHSNKWRFLCAASRDGWLVYERKAIIPTKENGFPPLGGVLFTMFKKRKGVSNEF